MASTSHLPSSQASRPAVSQVPAHGQSGGTVQASKCHFQFCQYAGGTLTECPKCHKNFHPGQCLSHHTCSPVQSKPPPHKEARRDTTPPPNPKRHRTSSPAKERIIGTRPFSTKNGPKVHFPWMVYVPEDLRQELVWQESHAADLPRGDILACLYSGKDDEGSLESAIHVTKPAWSKHTIGIDIEKPQGKAKMNMLAPEPWNSLCTAAVEGRLSLVGGGPNCRTVSVRRLIPKPNMPKPVRGRAEKLFWGLPGIPESEAVKVREDSILALRFMYLASLAKKYRPTCKVFFEHPADPAKFSGVQGAEDCASIWPQRFFRSWCMELGLKVHEFDQCELDQVVEKTTGIATDMDLGWDGMFCTHRGGHSGSGVGDSKELSRYPWKMMLGLAQCICKECQVGQVSPTPCSAGLPVASSAGQATSSRQVGNVCDQPSQTGAPVGEVCDQPSQTGTPGPQTPGHPVCCLQHCKVSPSNLRVVPCKVCGLLFHAACRDEHAQHCSPVDKPKKGRKDRPDHAPRPPEQDPHDDEQTVRVGFKSRPLRDGGGKPSPGRQPPPRRRLPLLGIGSVILQLVFAELPLFQASLAMAKPTQPFSDQLLGSIREALAPPDKWGVTEGQPFHLDAIAHVAWLAGDPDWQFQDSLKSGVPLGVDDPPLCSPGIWPSKDEMRGMESEDLE